MELSKREHQKAKTRQLILDTAFDIYADYGFQANTMQIAKKAGVSHGTIFSHFPTVDALIIALLDRLDQHMNLRLHELCRGTHCLDEILSAHLLTITEVEDFYRHLIRDMDRIPETARLTFVSIQSTVSSHFSNLIVKEQSEGKIKDIPIHILFNTWIGLVHHYLLNKDLFVYTGSVLDQHGRDLVKYFMLLCSL